MISRVAGNLRALRRLVFLRRRPTHVFPSPQSPDDIQLGLVQHEVTGHVDRTTPPSSCGPYRSVSQYGQTFWVVVRPGQPAVGIFTCVVPEVRSTRQAAVEAGLLNRDHLWTRWALRGDAVFLHVVVHETPWVPETMDTMLVHFLDSLLQTRNDLRAARGRADRPKTGRVKLKAAQVDRACGILVGAAVGDARSARGYEFGSAPLRGRPAMSGGGLGGFVPGEWTDDDAQTCAIGQVAATGSDLRYPEALDQIAPGFAQWYAGDPPDVGHQTRAVLEAVGPDATATEMTAAAGALHARTGHTTGNGSLKRTSPVALAHLDDEEALVGAALAVSALTHADPLAGTRPRSRSRAGWPAAPRRVAGRAAPRLPGLGGSGVTWSGTLPIRGSTSAGWGALDRLPADVNAVVSLCRVGQQQVPAGLKHVDSWLIDTDEADNPNLAYVIGDAARAVVRLRNSGETVLLHCVANAEPDANGGGAVRGAAGQSLDAALADVSAALPAANPNWATGQALTSPIGLA